MNLLFIGGAGFIGSNLLKRFGRIAGQRIFVYEPEDANVSRIDSLNVELLRGSLKEIDKVSSIISQYKIDVVVHLVSTLIPGSSYDDYIKEHENVIFPTIELMEFCAVNHVKFVYFSSGGTIYGNKQDFQPFHETDAMMPISYYGWSKQMMENSILFMNRTQGLEYLIVRPSNPYGPGQNIHAKQGIIAVAIGKLLRGEPVEVWGDGSAIRDYIYIDDLAECFYQLVEKQVCNETVNIGCGRGYSVNDVLAFLKIVSKNDFKIVFKDVRPTDVNNMVLDITKLRSLTNVEFTPLLEGIHRFYNEEVNKKNAV